MFGNKICAHAKFVKKKDLRHEYNYLFNCVNYKEERNIYI